MPTIPWMPGTAKDTTEPAGQPLVMASRLELRSLLGVPKFFLLSLVIFQQVRSSPGLLGASLKAEPLKRTFWTLSAWRDQEALNTFNKTDPHAKSVRGLRPGMKGSVFVFWNTEREQLPISWDEAQHRLAEQAEREAQST
ncbi:hypothetical protein GCM10022403_012450 [Streptomyces coacervatus]|uniref:DUF3291 domain-containing protein n=1 Tax=Streptomyces coacervatus TaxID=647381 RepID=A0ABP7H698_9ACTN|nr:DUF3291 domain-containing protein [Streptomyces coacervatus]MDF2273251.1 DUF3291 domain-containing protein [Streptomyces coacervatus]